LRHSPTYDVVASRAWPANGVGACLFSFYAPATNQRRLEVRIQHGKDGRRRRVLYNPRRRRDGVADGIVGWHPPGKRTAVRPGQRDVRRGGDDDGGGVRR